MVVALIWRVAPLSKQPKRDPGRGLLSRVLLAASPRTYYVVRYWESKEKLYAYASAADAFTAPCGRG